MGFDRFRVMDEFVFLSGTVTEINTSCLDGILEFSPFRGFKVQRPALTSDEGRLAPFHAFPIGHIAVRDGLEDLLVRADRGARGTLPQEEDQHEQRDENIYIRRLVTREAHHRRVIPAEPVREPLH